MAFDPTIVPMMLAFASVVEAGGFTAAAKQSGRSKASISKDVSFLEARLGTQLLRRTTRRLSLTEPGAAYYEQVQKVRAAIEDAEQIISQQAGEVSGTLRVSAPDVFTRLYLSPLLPVFLARFPKLTLELSISDRHVDLVGEGFDLALRITILEDSSLMIRKLGVSHRVMVASPEYLAKNPLPEVPSDLKNHDCLIYTGHRAPRDWRFDGQGKQWQVRVNGRFTSNSGDVLVQMAKQGLGIARLPKWMVASAINAGQLVELLVDFEGSEGAGIYAVWPPGKETPCKTRVFVDFLVEQSKRWAI